MIKRFTLTFSLLFFALGFLAAQSYPNVIFEGSIMDGNYVDSKVHYDGDSWVENINGHLPINDTLFFTPKNSLSIKYTSSDTSHWHVAILKQHPYQLSQQEFLSFKMRILTADISPQALPNISLLLSDTTSITINIGKYIGESDLSKWIDIKIPIQHFANTNLGSIITGVQLSQANTTTKTYHVLLDQIEVMPSSYPTIKLLSPAVLLAATPYDQHVDITWQLPISPSIRYIKIYRSADNKIFEPVAIRSVFVKKHTDFVPKRNATYYYKISWVDYEYEESPHSKVAKADVKNATDDELLGFVQGAHVNYFLEKIDNRTGMYLNNPREQEMVADVKASGLGLLTQIIGVEQGTVSRNLFKDRLVRLLDFLENATHYHGAFPAHLNIQTGNGVFANDSIPEVNLEATAYLINGLLTAKQYFNKDNNPELNEKIDLLWHRIDWNKFLFDTLDMVLYEGWSPVTGFKYASPIGGFNTGFNIYMLAMASPTHRIPANAYKEGLGVERRLIDTTYAMEIANNGMFAVNLNGSTDTPLKPQFKELPYRSNSHKYGRRLDLGHIDTALTAYYQIFLTFDPKNKWDDFANYYVSLKNLTDAAKRRDKEKQGLVNAPHVWGFTYTITEDPEYDLQARLRPAIATASITYDSKDAVKSIRELYHQYGKYLFTEWGFRSWIDINRNQVGTNYEAIDQAVVAIAIENNRTGLIWDLYMRNLDIEEFMQAHFSTFIHPSQLSK